jgi:hypothetical protein
MIFSKGISTVVIYVRYRSSEECSIPALFGKRGLRPIHNRGYFFGWCGQSALCAAMRAATFFLAISKRAEAAGEFSTSCRVFEKYVGIFS